jgi:hypothetical protein
MRLSQNDEGRPSAVINIQFTESSANLAPDHPAVLGLAVGNASTSTERVALEVLGAAAPWAALRPATFNIGPRESVVSTLVVEMPSPPPAPGRYRVTVQATWGPALRVRVAEATIVVRRRDAGRGFRSLLPTGRLRTLALATALVLLTSLTALASRSTDPAVDSTLAIDPRGVTTIARVPPVAIETPPISIAVAPNTTVGPAPSAATTRAVARPPVAPRPGRFVEISPSGVGVRTVAPDGTTTIDRANDPVPFGPYTIAASVGDNDVLLIRSPPENPPTAQLLHVAGDGSTDDIRDVSNDIQTWGYTHAVGLGNRWVALYRATDGFLAAVRWSEAGFRDGGTIYPAVEPGYTVAERVADGRILFANRETGAARIVDVVIGESSFNDHGQFLASHDVALDPGWAAIVGRGDGRVLFASRPDEPSAARVASVATDGTVMVGAAASLGAAVSDGVELPGGRAFLASGAGSGIVVTTAGLSVNAVRAAAPGATGVLVSLT